MEALNWKGARGGIAVVKMGHFIGAQNFAGGMLALIRSDGTLPMKPGTENINPIAEENIAPVVEVKKDEGDNGASKLEQGTTNGNNSSQLSQYTKEEVAHHHETLRQMKDIAVYHLFKYHIPSPIPPDMQVPASDPTPQDPSVPYNLLGALTTLRLRYEDAVKAETSKLGFSLSTTVSYLNDDQWGGHAAAADGSDNAAANTLTMDKAKVAAAAGGTGYDEEADPLNAPEVVAAVLQFKRRLEDQNVKGKQRRVAIITEKLKRKVKDILEKGRKDREKRGLQQEEQPQKPSNEPSKPAEGVEDTGRRGVSNLPAWMTKGANDCDVKASVAEPSTSELAPTDNDQEGGKKRKFVPSEANRDINVRKPCLDVEGGKTLSEIRAANEAVDKQQQAVATAPTTIATALSPAEILAAGSKFPHFSVSDTNKEQVLRSYVTAQIIDYVGEEESTLIDFIIKELCKGGGCTTLSLLEEMKVVLDEDAEDFVLGLYRKMAEM